MPEAFESSVSPPPLPLTVEAETRDTAVILHCEGSFAVKNHRRLDELVETVRKSPARTIVFDLRKVVFMDSVGVGTLAMICKQNFATGRQLRLVSNDMVLRMLTLACLDQVLPTFKSLDNALTPAKPSGSLSATP